MILHSVLIFVIISRIRKIKWGSLQNQEKRRKDKKRKEKCQQNC